MEKKILRFLLCLIVILSLFGCSVSDNNQVNTTVNPLGNSIINIKTTGIMFNTSQSRANGENPIVVAGLPANINKVVVTISGVNIPTPIVYNLVQINGVWQGILVNIPAGPATVAVQAYDNSNTLLYENSVNITIDNHATVNLNLTLLPVDPPQGYNVKAPRIDLVNISSKQVAPGDKVQLAVYAHDPAPGGPLQYIWTAVGVNGFDDRTSPTPTWTAPATEGFYQMTIVVLDEEFLLDRFTFTIEVNNRYGNGNVAVVLGTNDFPVITNMLADPTRIDKGQSTTLFVDAHDPDGDAITYSWTADRPGTFDNSTSAEPVFTIDPGVDYGPCVLTVTVSDGTLSVTGMIQINITPDPQINLAPVVVHAFQSANRVSPNGVIRYEIRAKDPEGTALTFTWNAPEGTVGTPTNTQDGLDYVSIVNWTAPASGTGSHVITVTITDTEGLAYIKSFLPVVMQ